MDHESHPTSGKKGLPMSMIALGAAVIIAIGAVMYINNKSQKEMAMLPKEQTATTAQATPTAAMMKGGATDEAMMKKGAYKDGTYEAMGHYVSPNGPEEIDISLTVKDGVVTDTNATPQATFPKSQNFQGLFSANYKPMVVGKKLDEVKLDKVAGSSLTPKGFNDAIEQIKKQAAQS